ncbi:MAG: outer membrane beta-barrel protein [Sphingobacteriaceae bacterium]|nr:outer membrane beta-barrel protein [Cytophagaceae bacterium]
MNIILKRAALALVVLAVLLSTNANAQIQLGLSGAHFSPTENGAKFSDGYWGGGVTGRYFVVPKFAVGLNGRYFARSESGFTINVIPVTAQAEFFFTEGKVRPYVGAEAGLYIFKAKFELLGVSESTSESNFGLAPKAGIQFMFTEKIGLDLNAGYHLIFPKKDQGDETLKTLILGAGLVFNVGGN